MNVLPLETPWSCIEDPFSIALLENHMVSRLNAYGLYGSKMQINLPSPSQVVLGNGIGGIAGTFIVYRDSLGELTLGAVLQESEQRMFHITALMQVKFSVVTQTLIEIVVDETKYDIWLRMYGHPKIVGNNNKNNNNNDNNNNSNSNNNNINRDNNENNGNDDLYYDNQSS
jgi:hypothetical protein